MQQQEAEVLDDMIDHTPSSLTAILEPDEALAAAQRMQRWYQSTPQGAAHSLFGRDGRRVEARLGMDGMHGDD